MAKRESLTAPLPSKKMPAGIPYIMVNEAFERFAFYGTRCILTVFMTQYLLGANGLLDPLTDEQAKMWFHTFVSAVYFTPLLGALLSDMLLGKFRTIIFFSLVYCVGVIALAVDHTRVGLTVGLSLIALGSGIVKPCVSANVGDQFGASNKHLISKVYNWFYWSINAGAFVSNFFIPEILARFGPTHGPTIAFGVPAGLMILATIAFWLGRSKFVHVPRAGMSFVKECFTGEGLRIIGRLSVIYLFVVPFWAIFDQMDSAWVLLATKLNLHWMGRDWQPSQVVSANPILILVLIPIFSYVIYPVINRFFRLTALRKIGIGLFLVATPFIMSGVLQTKITGGDVFKCSSRSTIGGLEPTKLLDGKTDGSGWSSASAPSAEDPAEIVISLRQSKAWDVNAVVIDSATTLSQHEIVTSLERVLSGSIAEGIRSYSDELSNGEIAVAEHTVAAQTKGVIATVKQAPDIETAKQAAAAALRELDIDTALLRDQAYTPKEVSVFVADFSGKLVPDLYVSMTQSERQAVGNATEYAIENGWTHVGDIVMDPNAEKAVLEFDPVAATHVLVQIKSNYGAPRAKVSEIEVMTDQPVPADANAAIKALWPNVAAIGPTPSVGWMFLAYVLLTSAEILVSITCLEFSYTQAPTKMKSFIMAVFFISISLGNIFTAIVNSVIANPDGTTKLAGAAYYWFFVIVMLVTAVLYIPVAMRFPVREYIQEEAATE